MNPRIIRLPFLIPPSAVAQVLLPGIVFVRRGYVLTVPVLSHELGHIEMLDEMGFIRHHATYVWLALRHPWASHPMELEAQRRGKKWRAVAAAMLGEDWEAA